MPDGRKLDAIRISNDGINTRVWVNDQEIQGVSRIEFIHSAKTPAGKLFPSLRLEIIPGSLELDGPAAVTQREV